MTQTKEGAAAKAVAIANRIAEVEKAERLVAQYTPEEVDAIWLGANPVRVAATELHRAVAIVESRFEIEPEPEIRQRFEATAREVRAIHRMTPELTDRARSVIAKLNAFNPKDTPHEDDREQGREAEPLGVVEAVSVDDAAVPDDGGPDRGAGDHPGGDDDADALRAEVETLRARVAELESAKPPGVDAWADLFEADQTQEEGLAQLATELAQLRSIAVADRRAVEPLNDAQVARLADLERRNALHKIA